MPYMYMYMIGQMLPQKGFYLHNSMTKVKWGNSNIISIIQVCCPPQTDSTHDAYAVGYSISTHCPAQANNCCQTRSSSLSLQKMEMVTLSKYADGAILTMACQSMHLHVSFTTARIYKEGKDGIKQPTPCS